MAGTIMPAPWFTGLDDNGVSVIGGKLYTYAAGTSTPQATYADVDLQVPNPNPLILDGGGRGTLYLSASSYKFVLKDANDVTIRTQDNIAATAPFSVDLDIAGVAGENLPAGSVVYLSVGAEAPPKTAGRWYLADADFAVSSSDADFIAMVQNTVLANAIGAFRLQGRTVVIGTPLTVGATYYVSTTPGWVVTPAPIAPAFERLVGIADSSTTLVTATGFGSATVIGGNVNISGDLTVTGPAAIGGELGLNGDLVFAGNYMVRRNTADGADAGQVIVTAAGGLPSGGARGAYVSVYGNEHPTRPGNLDLVAGAPGAILFGVGPGTFVAGVMHASGGFSWGSNADPGGGVIIVGGPAAVGTGYAALSATGQIDSSRAGSGPQLHVAFINALGVVGSIQTNGALTAYVTTSDATLKDDAGVVTETAVLAGLRVHDYDWKVDGARGRGVFAQEVQAVLPAAVSPGDDKRPWGIDYSQFVPDLIVGWQQHEARLLAVLERLEAVESRRDGEAS